MTDDRDEIVAFLDGELDAEGRRRVEERLRTDPHARAEADALQRTWALLDHLPRAESSPTFTSRTLTQVAAAESRAGRKTGRANWLNGMALAAGLLAAGGVGYALAPGSAPVIDLDRDPTYRSEPRLIENLPLYLAVENLEFLQWLDTPDSFGEDAAGR